MKPLLLDTHALLWMAADPARLGADFRDLATQGNTRLVWSVAGTWEMAIKAAKGGLTLPKLVAVHVSELLARYDVEELPIRHEHAAAVERLPHHHGDPFDRLLVAVAQVEGYAIATNDPWIRRYAVEIVW